MLAINLVSTALFDSATFLSRDAYVQGHSLHGTYCDEKKNNNKGLGLFKFDTPLLHLASIWTGNTQSSSTSHKQHFPQQ